MKKIIVWLAVMMYTLSGYAQDANFHIYLCLGQSNMEERLILRIFILQAFGQQVENLL